MKTVLWKKQKYIVAGERDLKPKKKVYINISSQKKTSYLGLNKLIFIQDSEKIEEFLFMKSK